jgi:AraC-like DNA-binding protein
MSITAPSAPTRPMPPATMHGTVRVAALLGVAPLLRERGIEPAGVLEGLGLDATTLDHADNRIRYRSAALLIQRCAELTACPHFGLLVGQRDDVLTLGTLGELMLKSPTVGSALRCLLLHLHLQTRGGVPTHTREGPIATLGYAIYLRDVAGTAQAYDLVMAFEFNILKALCGPRWRPQEVSFPHVAPKDLRPYRQYFRAPLRFDADRSEIRFDAAWLEQALPGHEVATHRTLQHDLARQLMMAPEDCAEQVRRALRTMILSGRGSEAQVCELMALPERSLRRALALQGTSFRVIVDEVRFEVARQLLADTDMSTNEIADALDYADASAFTRAFRRWTATPPAAWRKRLRLVAARDAASVDLEPGPVP